MNSRITSFFFFSFFKGISLCSVLLFYYFGYSEEYVRIEQAIATANIFVPLLILGVTTSFSHSKIIEKTSRFDWLYWSHFIVVFILTITGSVILFLVDSPYQITFMLLSVFCSSRLYSQKYKIENNVIFSSGIDAAPYILISSSFILVYLDFDITRAFTLGFVFFSITAFFVLIREMCQINSREFYKIKEFYSFSGGAFLVSSIVTGAMLSPRAISTFIFEKEELEIFLLTMRYGSIAVLFYQFIYIRFFSNIFKIDKKKILPYAVTFFLFSLFLVFFLLSLLVKAGFIYNGDFIVGVSILISCWIVSSFLEYFISRERRVKRFVKLISFAAPVVLFSSFVISPSARFPLIIGVLMMMVLIQLYSIISKCDSVEEKSTT